MRTFRSLVAFIVLVSAVVVVRPPEAVAVPPLCDGTNNDANWANAAGDEDPRCINGHPYKTRRRLKEVPGCLRSAPPDFE